MSRKNEPLNKMIMLIIMLPSGFFNQGYHIADTSLSKQAFLLQKNSVKSKCTSFEIPELTTSFFTINTLMAKLQTWLFALDEKAHKALANVYGI